MKLLLILLTLLIGTASYANDNDTIYTDTNSTITSDGSMDTTINSPPPSAISPQISASNSDLCTVGVAGAVQTQILGISAGRTVRGLVGDQAKLAWDMEAVKEEIERDQNDVIRKMFDENSETKIGLGVIFSTLAFLLLL